MTSLKKESGGTVLAASAILVLAVYASFKSPPATAMAFNWPANSAIELPTADRAGNSVPSSTKLLVIAPLCLACTGRNIPWSQIDAQYPTMLVLTESGEDAHTASYHLNGKTRIGIDLAACKCIPRDAFYAAPVFALLNPARNCIIKSSSEFSELSGK